VVKQAPVLMQICYCTGKCHAVEEEWERLVRICSKNNAFFSLDVLYAPRLPDLYFWCKSCVLYSRFYGKHIVYNRPIRWCLKRFPYMLGQKNLDLFKVCNFCMMMQKELNSLTYGMSSCIIIYTSYRILKTFILIHRIYFNFSFTYFTFYWRVFRDHLPHLRSCLSHNSESFDFNHFIFLLRVQWYVMCILLFFKKC